MTPEADPVHLSRQVWQAVSEHAVRTVTDGDFCPEQSRIENLRPMVSVDEDEFQYGRQIWCFEAMGIDAHSRRQIIYGLMEFSIQYGLLEPSQSLLFEDAAERDRCMENLTYPVHFTEEKHVATKFWVWAAWVSVAVLTGGWVSALVRYILLAPRELVL